MSLKPRTSPLVAASYAAGLVPFCFSLTINNINFVALGAGVICLLLGVGAMASTLTRGLVGESQGKRLVLAAGAIALAVWNILRGLGKL